MTAIRIATNHAGAHRTAGLQSHGYTVIRFPNADVMTHPDSVAPTLMNRLIR
ncbi:DUF559 domain-containing protein [Sphingomonas sp. Leaf21]|uniref:DUF559 domain-containing protein n=1 Tax=Sphingomonas sp. Leaf21 TaxID=2876550 RepID=UPI001E33AA31|nr:DUF559 domain-containing protein [Sphingomonas sp. Leaf21]